MVQLMIEYDPHPPYHAGHMSKASESVRALAKHEMQKASVTRRESWALMRLVGRRFVSHVRNKLAFEITG
jgi:hypothetical protein